MSEFSSNPEAGLGVSDAADAISELLSGNGKRKQPNAEPSLGSDDENDSGPGQQNAVADEQESESEPEVAEDEQDGEEPVKYRVKVDGKEIEVTQSELLAGYSRQQDYTRKTQELAEQRKAIEQIHAEIDAKRNHYAAGLHAIASQMQTEMGQEPDWESLYQENPLEFMHQRAKWEAHNVQMAKIQREQYRAQQEAGARDEQLRFERLQNEFERLCVELPDFRDDNKRSQIQKDIRAYGNSLGWSNDELADALDARAVLVLFKAMQFDNVAAKRKEITPSIEKVIRPGSSAKPVPQAQKVVQAARKTGSVRDAAAAIKALKLL